MIGSGWEILKRISSWFWSSWGSILGANFFLLYIINNDELINDVICNIAIYADDTTFYSKCDQVSDLWQQLELASDLQSDLWDTTDRYRKWLDFNAGKTQLVSFDQYYNTGAIDVKMDGSILEENHLLDAEVNSFFQIGLGVSHYFYY